MSLFSSRFSRRAALAALIAGPVVWVGYKAMRLAADPVSDKDCGPLASSSAAPRTERRFDDAISWRQKNGAINDASCLSRTEVYGIVDIREEADIARALAFARSQGARIALAAVRHSMGGQAFARDAIILDIRNFNRITLNEAARTVTVQSGATWHDIQNAIHPRFAVKSMQSSDIFSVGGSISVNAHGMDHRAGSVGGTVRTMRVMMADGRIETVSREANRELFDLIVGGYGLFGVILEAEIEITDNAIYDRGREIIDYAAFPGLYDSRIAPDERYGLMYGHLSTAPGSFLREMILYTYRRTDDAHGELPPLADISDVKLRRLVFNLSKHGDIARRIKWYAEKHIEPRFEGCSVTRADAQAGEDACFVSRNEPMHDSVPYLLNDLSEETDILQEYFVPRAQFVPFIDDLRDIITRRDAILTNCSVRLVHSGGTALDYAPFDGFAIVLYLNQSTDAAGTEAMKGLTAEIIDLAIARGGRFFLPYQLHYSADQFLKAYPEAPAFFAAKRRYDPDGLLTSTFYETYGPSLAAG
jgi:FAD/FMN-containing dehydrogenase